MLETLLFSSESLSEGQIDRFSEAYRRSNEIDTFKMVMFVSYATSKTHPKFEKPCSTIHQEDVTFKKGSKRREILNEFCSYRRILLKRSMLLFIASQFPQAYLSAPSFASLVVMPATQLKNRYYLVRAGESENEAEDYIDTNPVNKTSMSNGLSEIGKKQVLKQTIPKLRELGACKGACWVWPSITQNAYQTAEIMAYAFGLGRERIVPEYSFLDMRGLGNYDRMTVNEAYSKVHEIDLLGMYERPPPTTTGTPNESVMDVFVRVRQLLSVIETQYSNADIIVISPDSENLSILQSAALGEMNGPHWERAFAPGECRKLELAVSQPERKSFVMDCPKPPNCI